MPYTYSHPRPSVTVDIMVVRREDDQQELLLIERGHPPFAGQWALPGGFVDLDESIEAAAARELREETAITDKPLRQLKAFGNAQRDPRGYTVTIVFGLQLNPDSPQKIIAGDDARHAKWFPINKLPALAFDHQQIVSECLPILLHKTDDR